MADVPESETGSQKTMPRDMGMEGLGLNLTA
jgi:hypothetical protein